MKQDTKMSQQEEDGLQGGKGESQKIRSVGHMPRSEVPARLLGGHPWVLLRLAHLDHKLLLFFPSSHINTD